MKVFRGKPRVGLWVGIALLFSPSLARAQGIINTIVGGGPNNIPALSAGLGKMSSVTEDSLGNIYATALGRVFKVTTPGKIFVFAGNGFNSFGGDGGPATDAGIDPQGLAVDRSGNVFIADRSNYRVREVAAATGKIQTVVLLPLIPPAIGPTSLTVDSSGDLFIGVADQNVVYELSAGAGNLRRFAGTGAAGFGGDTGPAVNAELSSPAAVSVDSAGNVFIADGGNCRIREVQASTGDIVTVAGNGTRGFAGDGGAPTNAELNSPRGVFVSGAGNIYIADSSNLRVREIVASTGLIQTVAGTGTQGFTGDGGPATSAELFNPASVWVDNSENILIADNNRVRTISAASENIQTIAGNGTLSLGGDGFPALDASLSFPFGLTFDGSGDLLIADSENSAIRKLVRSTGDIQTIAGTGIAGYSGDGSLATAAELNDPTDMAADLSGNIFVMDTGNNCVREILSAGGGIQTVEPIFVAPCGNSQTQRGIPFYYLAVGSSGLILSTNGGVYVDAMGNIFSANTNGCTVTEQLASNGQTVIVAGDGQCGFSGDGGPAIVAHLSAPAGITGDKSGNIFIADSANNVIREVVASTGMIVSIAGNGAAGFSGDGGPAIQASLSRPIGVAVDSSGNLWIADWANFRVREVQAGFGAPAASISPGSVTFSPAVVVGSSAPSQNITLSNLGSAALSLSSISTAGANNLDFTQTNNCGGSLAPKANCTIAVRFTPTAGGGRASNLRFTDNAVNSPQDIALAGIGADYSMIATTSTSATVAAGQTADYTLNVVTSGGFSQTVALACSGAPPLSTCSLPSSVSLNGSGTTTVNVSVTTTPNSSAMDQRSKGTNERLLACGLFGLPLFFTLLGRCERGTDKNISRWGSLVVFSMVLAMLACGGGRSLVGGGNGGTPSGTYVVTVTGTSVAGTALSRNIPLTLIIK